uniref:DB domain-containing protein n=1 Tax=Rhabditophanes sp. KR3021 TaxID=114890 RepID=A0AC35TKS9_9BILA
MQFLALIGSFLFVYQASACLSSGMCGGGGGCAPPPPVCSPRSCGGGMSCGSYGCYQTATKARVAGAKTFSTGKDDEYLLTKDGQVDNNKVWYASAMEADAQFYQCCVENQLPDSCLGKCSYSGYTRDSIRNMFLRIDTCPLHAASVIQYCAARGQNHFQCCADRGVHTTMAGEKCLIFCDQRPGNVTQLDISYLPCYDKFDEMKSCFYNNVFTSVMNNHYKKLARA